jgi:hypothetical protein
MLNNIDTKINIFYIMSNKIYIKNLKNNLYTGRIDDENRRDSS